MNKLFKKNNSEECKRLALSDYIKIKHGYAFKGEYFSVEPTSDILVTPGNFAIGGGFKSNKFKYYKGPVPEDYILKENDLIVTMTDLSVDADTLGYSALIPSNNKKRFLHNQRVGLVKKYKDGIDLGYLYYLMHTRQYQKYVVSTASGSTVKHTSPDRITAYEHDFPPILIQKKIYTILSAYDAKIENNNNIIKNLEATAQIIFDEWFVVFHFPNYEQTKFIDSKLGKIPEEWKVKNVLDVVERIGVGKKYDNKSALQSGNIPIIDQGESGFIGYHNDDPGVFASPDNPVVIFTNHTCYYRLLTEPFSCIQNVLPYIGKNGYPTLFVYFLTKEKIKMSEYKGHWPDFEQQTFVIPPKNIADAYTLKITPLINEIILREKEIVFLKAQRDQLLNKLI